MKLTQLLTTTAAFALSALGVHAATVTAFSPAVWPRTDADLGITGFQIEDFEDATLIPGLQVQLSGGSADFGPTSTIPHVFTVADDPNGSLFSAAIWDGTHFLLNRNTAPVPVGYVDSQWADISFLVPGGTQSLGFSLHQLEVTGTQMSVTTTSGVTIFGLDTLPNFSVNSGRNGYVRVDADPGESILSVKVDNLSGDGFAFDHVAVNPVPEPTSAVLLLAGVAGLGLRRRR